MVNKKIKIGINGRFLSKPFTGIGLYTINLFAKLAQQHADLEIVMATTEDPPKWVKEKLGKQIKLVILPENFLLKRINAGLAKSFWEKMQLGSLFQREKVQLIHCPYPAIFKRLKNVPVIMTVHDTFPWTLADYQARTWLSRIYNAATLKAAQKADVLFSVSNFSKEEILKITGFSAEKIEVIYNACEFNKSLISNSVLQKFGLVENGYLLYMGGYDKRKNVQRLANIFSKFIVPETDYKLVLGGASVLKNNLFEEIKWQGEAKRLVQTGFLASNDLEALYSGAKAFISLTTAEGFNLPLLEALSTNCVALVSDLKVHREVADQAAYYLDLNLSDEEIAKQIVTLLKIKKEYSYFKEKAEEFRKSKEGKRFSWDNSAQQTAQIYKKLIWG